MPWAQVRICSPGADGSCQQGSPGKNKFPPVIWENGEDLENKALSRKMGRGCRLDNPGCLEVKVQGHEASETQTQLKQLSKPQGHRARRQGGPVSSRPLQDTQTSLYQRPRHLRLKGSKPQS